MPAALSPMPCQSTTGVEARAAGSEAASRRQRRGVMVRADWRLESGDTNTEITLYHHPEQTTKYTGHVSRDLSLFYIYPDRYKYLESININTCWRITRCEDDKNI